MTPTDDRRDPDELRDLLGAYALGALDDEERARVEDYVLHDADARAELHKLEHAVAWMGHASPRPSEAAWDAVRAEMANDLAGAGTGAPAPTLAPVAATPADDVDEVDHIGAIEADPAPVVDLHARRSRPTWQRLTAIAAAVAIVLGVGLGMLSVFSADDGSDTTTVALAAPNGRVAVTAEVDTDGTGTIVRSSLPRAPAGHIYQLWSQPDPQTSMHSAGLLGTDPSGHHIRIPAHTHRIAISVEPTGGSTAPTTDPVAVSGDGQL
jgi:anti-sigma-K factor RskA